MADDDKPKTVSIFDVLATLPSGRPSAPLRPEELTKYLQEHYDKDTEKGRNNRHALRDELYRDGGIVRMNEFIDSVFTDTTVRDLRRKWVPYARFNNAVKRIVNELATIYSEPARRFVSDPQPEPVVGEDGQPMQVEPVSKNNDAYQQLLEAVRMDERALEASRLLVLHRALLIGFRVRMKPNGEREPVVDIVTPANARAITHPNDDTLVVGWLIRVCHKTARTTTDVPAWMLWTDHESLALRDDLSVIPGEHIEHGLGVCPWVPITLGPPQAGFWPGAEGEDLVAAHMAIWFQNILLLKESKSATKQTIIQGDGTNMARGQAADSEIPNELADGQNATTVDMSMDLSMFRDTNDHVLNNVAHNYGMSPAIVQHQGVQSAEARDLMRLPLKEIRRQQQIPWRRCEHQLAIVMSAVTKVDLPQMHFVVDSWRIEFAESETPLDPISEMDLFDKRSAKGLDNEVAYLMRKYPGLDESGALQIIKANVAVKTEIQRLMRPFMQISGALGAQQPLVGQPDRPAADNDNAPADPPPAQDTTA